MNLGMAFQVIDDCLDYAGEESVVGKSLGTDLRQGKLTLPLLALRDSLEGAELESFKATIRAAGSSSAGDERALHDRVVSSGVLETSFARATGFVDDARAILRSFANHGITLSTAEAESLELAAGYVLRRQK